MLELNNSSSEAKKTILGAEIFIPIISLVRQKREKARASPVSYADLFLSCRALKNSSGPRFLQKGRFTYLARGEHVRAVPQIEFIP